LSESAYQELQSHLQHGRYQAALEHLAGAVGLQDLSRIQLEVTPNLGSVRDVAASVPAGGRGEATAWIPSGSTSASDIHVVIQLAPALFRGDPAKCIPLVHTTLMHEYTHARQLFASGLGMRREPHGDFEILRDTRAGAAAPLDEIDAICGELENARVTGLAGLVVVRDTIGYLWENFMQAAARRIPERAAIAARVLRAILSARDSLFSLVSQREFAYQLRAEGVSTPILVVKQYLFPPDHYSPDAIAPYLEDGALMGEARAQWQRHLAFVESHMRSVGAAATPR
jgi:hypothetical protein